MRRLHTKVNLIPIIAKADTLTDEEIASFKQRVSLTLSIPKNLYIMHISGPERYRVPQDPDLPGADIRE